MPSAVARGEPRDVERHRSRLIVKAMTWHQLKIVQTGLGWAAEIEAIDALRHRIARDERRGMRTDVVVYASEALITQIRKDLSLDRV